MEFVCNDINGATSWHYDAAKQRYYRLTARGDMVPRISGKYLLDPFALWAQRCADKEVQMGSEAADAYKPQEAVFALWNHWQGVNA